MRSLRARFTVLAVTSGLIGAAGLSVLAVLGLLDWVAAVQLAATGAVGVAAGGTGILVWRLTRMVRRLSRELDAHTHRVSEAIAQDRVEIISSLDATKGEVRRIRKQSLPGLARDLVRQGRHDYEQQVAWTELRDFLALENTAPFMPSLRGWAASPDVLRILVAAIDEHRPTLVVECGSGASSVWMGYALRRAGGGRLVALEHDERYAELSRELVAAHGLSDVVEVRHAPLTDWTPPGQADSAAPRPWYDEQAVADLHGIGLVFVDGPPEATAEQARYPAVPVLLPRCAFDAVLVLDDADRGDERAISDRWLTEHQELTSRDEVTEKGARVFTRNAS